MHASQLHHSGIRIFKGISLKAPPKLAKFPLIHLNPPSSNSMYVYRHLLT